ncbi:MAG TPA: FkbM family methyltransferase [Alphaproteobacteria bacterium]|nr:FkbM family methyltransferase [Alphaproteobacteria bacterium]
MRGHLYEGGVPITGRESLRDCINYLRQGAKYKWIPGRLYYRYRSHKYMQAIDPEMGLLKFLIDRSKLSLDVGANLGLYTYYLARYSSHVHAFEPNPLAFDVLRSVVDANVTLHQVALSDQTTDHAELVVPRGRRGWSNNGASLTRAKEGRYGIARVAAKRIDDLVLDEIGFIKIDVEGHELSVLHGATETLRRQRPVLFLENEHAHVGSATEAVFALLRSLEYDGFFLAGGVLRNVSHFDVQRFQIEPRAHPQLGGHYVKNFIFLPR